MNVEFITAVVVGTLLLAAMSCIAVEARAGRDERNHAVGSRFRSTPNEIGCYLAGRAARVPALLVLVVLNVLALLLTAIRVVLEVRPFGLGGVLPDAVLIIVGSASPRGLAGVNHSVCTLGRET